MTPEQKYKDYISKGMTEADASMASGFKPVIVPKPVVVAPKAAPIIAPPTLSTSALEDRISNLKQLISDFGGADAPAMYKSQVKALQLELDDLMSQKSRADAEAAKKDLDMHPRVDPASVSPKTGIENPSMYHDVLASAKAPAAIASGALPAKAEVEAKPALPASLVGPPYSKKAEKVAKSYGLTILEAVQAGLLGYLGGSTGNWQTPEYAKRVERETEDKRISEARASDEKKWREQMELTRSEAALDREAARIALDKSLSMEEKIAKLREAQGKLGLTMSGEAAAIDILNLAK